MRLNSKDSAITWNSNCFSINGKRSWLISGSFQPFRIPFQEWEHRLRLFVMAGLNCVEVYTPWNLHEPEPGRFCFSGRCDMVSLMELCKKLNLYVIFRPGPYICAEWDMGGYPAWILKEDVLLREPDRRMEGYISRYFKKLLRPLIPYQITESDDGPIILVQVENEYWWKKRPGGMEYLEFLRQLLLEIGITVPLIDCNMLYNNPPTLHFINGNWNYPQNFQEMRRDYPDQPLMVSEYHCGWYNDTAEPYNDTLSAPEKLYRNNMLYLSRGAMKSYYTFAGGTNFGNMAAKLRNGVSCTASYDFNSPITEGGGLTDKYYFARLSNRIERLFSEQLSQSQRYCEAVYVHSVPHAITRQTPAGDIVFAFKTIDEPPKYEELPLIYGKWNRFTARFSPNIHARVLPVHYKIFDSLLIDFLEAQLFHAIKKDDEAHLYLFDEPETSSRAGFNGDEYELVFPKIGAPPAVITLPGKIYIHLFTLKDALACKFNTEAGIFAPHRNAGMEFIIEELMLRPKSVHTQLSNWKFSALTPEKNGIPLRSLAHFDYLENLDTYYKHGLFQCTYQNKKNETSIECFIPHTTDRYHLFSNGKLQGVFGYDKHSSNSPLTLKLRPGENRVFILAGNWGRDVGIKRYGERKGFQEVCRSRTISPPIGDGKNRVIRREEFEKQLALESILNVHLSFPSSMELYTCAIKIEALERLYLEIPDSSTNYWIFEKESLLHFSAGRSWIFDRKNFPDTDLLIAFQKKECRDKFLQRGFHYLELTPLELEEIGFAPLSIPKAFGSKPPLARTTIHPLWMQAEMHLEKVPPSGLLLNLKDMSRGQLYINGRHLCRYWQPSCQELYWVPASWLKLNNLVTLLDEEGRNPENITVEVQSHGPFKRYPEVKQ